MMEGKKKGIRNEYKNEWIEKGRERRMGEGVKMKD